MMSRRRWTFRFSVVLLIASLLAPLAGTPASADSAPPEPAPQASPASPDTGAGDLPAFTTLIPQAPIETPAVCSEGKSTAPDLTAATTPGITYSVDPAAPWSAGQAVTIIAQLDDPATAVWTATPPEGWLPGSDGSSLIREFTFTDVPCEPATGARPSGAQAPLTAPVSIDLTAPSAVEPGETLILTVTITPSTPIVLLPFELQLDPALSDWTLPAGCAIDAAHLVTCANPAMLVQDFIFTTIVPEDTLCTTYQATATLRAPYSGTSGPVSTEVACDEPEPDLSIAVTGPESAVAGSPLRYTIALSNAGDASTSGYMVVMISLPDTGNSWTASRDRCTIVAPNSMRCYFIQVPRQVDGVPGEFRFTVSSTIGWDVTCGDVSASATVHDNLDDDPEYISSNTATTSTGCQNATVSQMATQGPVAPGDLMEFTYSVENLGPDLSNWSFGGPRLLRNGTGWRITDRSGAFSNSFCNLYPFSREDGVTCSARQVFEANTTATMTVSRTATPADCGRTFQSKNPTFSPVSSQDSDTVRFTGNDASISVECTSGLSIEMTGPATAEPGDTLDYGITLTNTGYAPATGVTVTASPPGAGSVSLTTDNCTVNDDNSVTCTGMTIPAASNETPGTLTIPVSYIVPTDGTVCGDAEPGASYSIGETDPAGADSVTTTIACDAELTLDLSADPAQATATGSHTLTYTLVNDGNIDLTNVTFEESIDCDPGTDGIQNIIESFSTGSAATCFASFEITQQQMDNADAIAIGARAFGYDGMGNIVWSSAAETTIEIVRKPSVSLTVTPSTTIVDAPGMVDFTFTLKNTGNVTLSDVSLDEGLPVVVQSFLAQQAEPLSLSPGESTETTGMLQVTQADIDAGVPIDITSTLSATTPGGAGLSGSVDTRIFVPQAGPALGMTKTATTLDGETPTEGSVITYTFEVTNIGNVTMSNIVVNDRLPNLVWDASDGRIATLAPNDSVIMTAIYTVTLDDAIAGEVVNSATATGDGPRCETDVTDCGIASEASSARVAVDTATPTPSPTPSPTATPEPTTSPTPSATPTTAPTEASTPAAITGLPTTGSGGSPLASGMSWGAGLVALLMAIVALGWRFRSRE